MIARNSSFTYKGKAINVKQVARELGVRYLLEGSIRRSGPSVRIAAQLIEAETGAHLWAGRFDGRLDDVFQLQDDVAAGVVGTIEPKLRSAEALRAGRKPPNNLDAYDLYLRALANVHKLTRDTIESAIRLSLDALEIDPSYTPASALAGWCYAVQKWQGMISPGSEHATGLRLARQAVQIPSDDPDTLWMAAHTLAYLGTDHATATSLLTRALALNPNSARAWGTKGLVDSYRGHAASAIDAFDRAIRLSPLDPLNYHYRFGIGLSHLGSGSYQDALEWVDESVREQPGFAAGLRVKLALCGHLGHVTEARDCMAQLLELQPTLTVAVFEAPPHSYRRISLES